MTRLIDLSIDIVKWSVEFDDRQLRGNERWENKWKRRTHLDNFGRTNAEKISERDRHTPTQTHPPHKKRFWFGSLRSQVRNGKAVCVCVWLGSFVTRVDPPWNIMLDTLFYSRGRTRWGFVCPTFIGVSYKTRCPATVERQVWAQGLTSVLSLFPSCSFPCKHSKCTRVTLSSARSSFCLPARGSGLLWRICVWWWSTCDGSMTIFRRCAVYLL